MEYFGLKLGQDLGNRAAHPFQEFRGVPPRDCIKVFSAGGKYQHKFGQHGGGDGEFNSGLCKVRMRTVDADGGQRTADCGRRTKKIKK